MTTHSSTEVALTIVPDPTTATLEDWGPLPEGTGAPMATEGMRFWTGEGVLEAGIWKCAPGPSHWTFTTNESFTIFAGRMTVTQDGGEAQEFGPGDSAVFPQGWAGTWDLHETVVKFYTVF